MDKTEVGAIASFILIGGFFIVLVVVWAWCHGHTADGKPAPAHGTTQSARNREPDYSSADGCRGDSAVTYLTPTDTQTQYDKTTSGLLAQARDEFHQALEDRPIDVSSIQPDEVPAWW